MIELGFRNLKNQVQTVLIKPDETELAEIWIKQLDRLLSTHQDKIFQKNFSLLGFHNEYRTIEHICDDLERSIKIINQHNQYSIHDDFTSLRYNYDQELLNILHHHFEITQGQLWNPGSVLSNANGETRLAICYLNHCCHEIEAWYDSENLKKSNLVNAYFYYNLLGITERIEIDPKFKGQFTKNIEDGLVYLHYAQTGKTWYEAYFDNDDVVTPDGISEHRVISGEFNCYFGTGYQLPTDEKFSAWLEARGVDPKDEQLALGYAPVGKIENMPYNESIDFFKEYTDFFSIKFNGNYIEYDYRHTDQRFRDSLKFIWDKWGEY